MGWWRKAQAGQDVVCIDDGWDGYYSPTSPRRGQVCKIEDMIVIDRLAHDGCPLFLKFAFDGGGYNASCFRPVQPKSTETGMKMIRSILDRAPVKEDA